jgi:hypothetical protein
LDLRSSTQSEYLTPVKTGGLRIVDEKDGVLTLTSKEGQAWSFDVSSRRFVELEALPQWPEGVFNFGQARFPAGLPFAANVFDIVNVWQGRIGEEYVRILVGSLKADPDQGLVVTQRVPVSLWYDVAPRSGRDALELSPARTGGLRIEAYGDGKLTLRTAGGAHLLFDIQTEELSP